MSSISKTADYCKGCTNILNNLPKTTEFTPHSEALILDEAKRRECHFCFFLWNVLTESEKKRVVAFLAAPPPPTRPNDPWSRQRMGYELSIDSDATSSLRYTFIKTSNGPGSVEKTVKLAPSSRIEPLLSQTGLPPATDLESSVAYAFQWLVECEENHDCHGNTVGDAIFLPTRLIDVGESPEGSDLHLALTSTLPFPAPPYMTLSHCWGTLAVPRLLTYNQNAFLRNIPNAFLPQTFRDAVAITRTLGIRYIWIDSLCIQQDSEDDWLHESILMGEIYSHSYCNISATAARDGSEGCFFPRDEMLIDTPRLVTTSEDTTSHDVLYAIDTNIWMREFDFAPLNQRGWVFQERFLAPRNLSFGARRLFWECGSLRACEGFPGGLPPSVRSEAFRVSDGRALQEKYVRKRSDNQLELDRPMLGLMLLTGAQFYPARDGEFKDPQGPSPSVYRHWTTILNHYTPTLLSQTSDKLIALQGIASWMEHHYFMPSLSMSSLSLSPSEYSITPSSKSPYVAGLWLPHLINQLLWTTSANLRKFRPPAYRAPSWSWASISGKIVFHDILEAEEYPHTATVLSVDLQMREGKKGQLIGGELRMRGKVFGARWKAEMQFSTPRSEKDYALSEGKTYGESEWTGKATPIFDLSHPINGTVFKGVYGFPDAEEDSFRDGETWCLALWWDAEAWSDKTKVVRDQKAKDSKRAVAVKGLVLARAPTGSETGDVKLRRVGWWLAKAGDSQGFAKLFDVVKEDTVVIV